MKYHFYTWISCLLLSATSFAQTTITTTGITGNGSGVASPLPTGVSFSVQNTNGAGIIITDVGYSAPNTSITELWYSATSLTGNTGPISTSSTAWSKIATVNTPSSVSNTVITNNFFTGLNLLIPANTTYRFAVLCYSNVRYSATAPSPTVFSSGGVNLDVTNTLWGGATFTNGLSNSGRYYFGSITFIPAGPPCPAPTGLSASAITSSTATLSWNPVSGSVGYDYIIDQNVTVPNPNTPVATTSTSVNATGLIPSTNYYLHVRNKCSSINFSPWITYAFTTLPPCKPPIGFNVTNLTPNSATINWAPWLSAISYDYIVDQSNTTPGSTTAATNTLLTYANLSGLQENTWYYVHIRSKCAAAQESNWSLDSFLTPIPCRPPDVKISHINTDEAVAYWAAVPTAIKYEYAITTSSTPPVQGTMYNFTSIHTSALDDGKDYYIHVRSHCICLGISSTSDWGTTSFKTFPTNIATGNRAAFNIAAWPNPVRNIVTIQVNGNTDANASLIVTDMSGKTLQTVPVTGKNTEIDMSGVAAGLYMIKYIDNSHNTVIKINKG